MQKYPTDLELVSSQVADQCRRLLDTMFSISLMKSTYLVSVKMFLKTMEKIWLEIPRKIAEVDRLRYFVEQLRVSMNSQVSAGLIPEHKLVWSLLLALQATGMCYNQLPGSLNIGSPAPCFHSLEFGTVLT